LLGDLWNWAAGVFGHIGDVSIYWLALALALKTAESAFIGLTWRNILDAAYPHANLSLKTAWGASQGGTAINAVAPAQAGTATMIGIFRRSIPGSSVAGVTSATIVQSLFFTGVSVLMVCGSAILRPRTVSKGSPSNETGGLFASHPVLVPIAVVLVVAVLYFLWPRLKPRLLKFWHNARQGAAIFRDWRRYLREVAPGGVGQTQALDVVTLRGYGSHSNIAAFSITQDAVITIWNVVLGLAVGLWAFGYTRVKATILRRGKR